MSARGAYYAAFGVLALIVLLFCGMAVGYADPDAPVNAVESPRMELGEFAAWVGG